MWGRMGAAEEGEFEGACVAWNPVVGIADSGVWVGWAPRPPILLPYELSALRGGDVAMMKRP